MKKNYPIYFIFFVLFHSSVWAQNLSFRHNGDKVKLTESTSKYIVQFKYPVDYLNFSKKKNTYIDSIKPLISGHNVYILYKNGSSTENFKNTSDLTPDIISINPVLLNNEGKELGALSNQIIVRIKQHTRQSDFFDVLRNNLAKIDRRAEYDSLTYLISLPPNNAKILELSENLHQSQMFDYVEPNFWLFVDPASNNMKETMTACATDQYYLQQWGLNNTGQLGGNVDADIDAPEAWSITTGSSSIRIAIIDNGVERNHPDLSANISGGFDATDGPGTCPLPGTLGNPDLCAGDYHGTMVAGVAAAVGCTGTGVTGVAYSSKIVPIRAWKGNYITNVDWMASAINYARNNAEIINMSFTLTSAFSTIDAQLGLAITSGRGGKGAILVAATGNDGYTSIPYPASYTNVVAVGNTTRNDLRYTDSNYGSGIDVVAPGTDIWSTDLVGFRGLSTTSDYAMDYGTSYASPAVAGAFALILSANPNVTYNQARLLLESTTDKISQPTYSYATTAGQVHGTWNSQVGYGRINANNALLAMRNSNLTGPTIVCTSATFAVTIKPNVTRTWYSSNTSILTINSSTGVATRVGTGSGPVTITMRYSSSLASYDITKEIWVGTPDVSTIKYDNGVSAGGGNYVTPYSNHTVYLDQQNVIKANVTNTEWDPNPNIGYGYGMGFSQFDFSLNPGSTVVFNPVSSTNICGTTNRSLSFTANSSFLLAPNPATTELKIIFDNVDSKENIPILMTLVSESTLQTVKNLTRDDVLRNENIKSTKTFTIDVSKLPRGVYFFQAKQDETSNIETKSIRVLLQ
ncbi:S8 family serine peptidase [Dyadobacter sp. CY261]|uniref:S8 family serine peptidase n=1 Tax=Dyadobacter sp. CY261 TaxID=2907203 RepID=UPI001F1634FB|nr:S8 family serine peptidase [Dyadobacter sp. CY261]MCF0075616.1 S8 family serine peptidase [Dyadobacter sp. CY261]